MKCKDHYSKKANGYNAIINKTFKLKKVYYDDEGRRCEEENLASAEDEVHVPADTTAQIFWLKNRRPDKWRDKVEEVSQSSEKITIINDLGDGNDSD